MDKRPSTFRKDLTVQDHHQVIFKQGKPDDHDLDELAGKIAAKWQELGLRLGISQNILDEIGANKERKAYWMLIHWRNTTASATLYCDLYHALCHDRVGLNNVAKEFCVSFQSSPQDPKRPKLTSEDEAGSSGHGRPPSSLEDNKSPFLAGPQTPVQIYQTSHPHSSSGYQPSSMEYSRFPSALGGQTLEGPSCADHSRPYSSAEYSQLPFVAVTQETTGFRGHGSSPSLLEYNQLPFLVGHQTPVQTYMCQTSHPQSFSGYRPSSVEYSTMFPSALGGQTHKGPSYQTWHSPSSPGRMSASAAYRQLPCAVASQIHERHNYQREDTQRSSDHSVSLSVLEHCQLRCPAGAQTPTPTYQTSHSQSSPGHGSLPSLLQYNQLPFPAGTQTPVQTYQTSHPQSSSGYQLSSMESSRCPSVLSGQTLQGPRCQTWHSPTMFMTGGYHQLPFCAATQTHGELTCPRSHHPQSFPGHGSSPSSPEYNQLPFPAGPQTPVQTYPTNHRQSFSGYQPSSAEYSTMFPSALGGQTHKGPSYQIWHSPISFQSSPQDPKRPRLTSADEAGSTGHGRPPSSLKYNKSSILEGPRTPVQIYQTRQPHSSSGYQPSSMEYSNFPSALGGQTRQEPKACPADMFDVKTCQKKLAEYYQKTAKVPTTAWSSVIQEDLEQIYTRLSWVKQEQTTAGSSQKNKKAQTTAGEELNHYTEIFTVKTTNGVVAKRILVQGETGIGKTTFVKKLLVDWSNLEEAKMDEERKDALKKFDLVVSVNLKEVSNCQTFKEAIIRCGVLQEDDETSVDDMLRYIRANQDKVLLVFDGYDEYRTGSEAQERYGKRSSSEIYKIFHGDIYRDCTVLVTTRSSRADEIRVPADIQAEITGFNILDREDFMRKMLDSESDVDGLMEFLQKNELNDLARVPLLSLFFCLLWNSEKDKFMELTGRKSKLYQAIVKHILRHSHRRRSSSEASKFKETDYEEILAEIGKVALAGLLKGDLVFEFGKLSEKVRGEEGVIVGLFQFSEYGQSLEPMEMVSFIHKSIQEYLAAWYLIYSCVLKGSLGEIEQHARALENCEAWENVFQFVCGLSDEGAVKVLEHLTSVRMSDPTLDLSKAIPDVETETEVPVCDVTRRHKRFSNLVYDSFQEVQSKVELLSNFLHCTGGVILVSARNRPFFELIPDVKVLTKLTHNFVFIFMDFDFPNIFWGSVEDSMCYKSLDFLKCLQNPLRVTDSSEVLTVEDIIRKFHKRGSCFCMFSSILCFLNGQFQFYITKLRLRCDDHARVFTESTTISVPCNAESLCSETSCLKFLRSLSCEGLSSQTVKGLGAVIENCKHLSRIELLDDDDSICYLLEQVRRPSKCAVKIARNWIHSDYGPHLTSVGAVQLASLLSKFNNVVSLGLDLKDCSAAAVETLVTSITHKTLNELELLGITSAASKTLGRSLPEMSSLQRLALTGFYESILEADEMKALFGGFKKAMPLCQLTIKDFRVRSLSPLIKCLRFFPHLGELVLDGLNIDEHDQCCLLKRRFRFLTGLTVNIAGDRFVDSFRYVTSGANKIVHMDVTSLTPVLADLLGSILPELSSLESLEFFADMKAEEVEGMEAEKMETLLGGFNKAMPLYQLNIIGFNVTSLSPLAKCLRFFPDLKVLRLDGLGIGGHDQCRLLNSFRFLTKLEVRIHGDGETSPPFVYSTFRKDKKVKLHVVSLTPAVAAMLGRILPGLSSLKSLKFSAYGSILEAEKMEALFRGFNKTMPLHSLMITGFYERGGLAPLFRSFRFFPNLVELKLEELNMDEHDLRGLLESFKFIPNLQKLDLSYNRLGHAITSIVPHVIHLKKLRYLYVLNTGHSEEDLNYVRHTVQQALPELKVITNEDTVFLQVLEDL